MIVALCTGPGHSSWARLFSNVVPPTQRCYKQDHWSGISLPILKLIFFSKNLYSRHVSVTVISSASHMVGPSKNSSRLISRTNVRMHANAVILEMGQIEGLRLAKEMNQVMTRTRLKGLVTWMRAAMELEGKT